LKVYVCGPMRSVPFFNFPAFDAAAVKLMARGYKPLSPADIDRKHGFDAMLMDVTWDWNKIPEHLNLPSIVRRDVLAIIDEADGYCTLPGWEQSKGARAEVALCQWLGLKEVVL
jgi:Domain of unknown function (DUF4406)